ncbi:unnamed protein product [Closterium sp. NIES-53]
MRSSVWLERFKELQLEIHQTNLEHQGLFDVRWLSRGDTVARLCRILGAAIVVFIEYNHSMAVTVQTLKFHFCLYFLADLLAEINALNKFFQRKKVDITLVHQEVDRTIGVIRLRYVEYVDIFRGGQQVAVAIHRTPWQRQANDPRGRHVKKQEWKRREEFD